MLKEYGKMLLESSRRVHEIISNPRYTDENKMIIAGANTLAQTAKTAIQIELLQVKSQKTAGNTRQLINKLNGDEINSLEG